MKNYSLLHSANTGKHQHNFIIGNIESHITLLMLELGHYVAHLEHKVYSWIKKSEEFFAVIYKDKKLFVLFCFIMLVAIIIAQLLLLIIKLS